MAGNVSSCARLLRIRPGVRRDSAGLSLVELMAAVLILAFCLSGIALTFIDLYLLTDMSRDTTLAANAVQAKAETLNSVSFANLTTQAGLFNLTTFGFPSAQSKGRVEVQTDFGGYANDLTKVRIIACYQSRGKTVGNSIVNCTSSPVETVVLRTK